MTSLGLGSVEPPYATDPHEKRKPVQREWQAQKADNAFLSRALPQGAYYTAIDHARKMTKDAGKQRKDRGIKSGIPDWLIVWNGITLWIERKAGSSLSEHQRTTRDYLTRNGHRWALAKSTEEIEIACREAGIPLRATFGGIVERIAEQRQRAGMTKKRAARRSSEKPAQRGGLTSADLVRGWS